MPVRSANSIASAAATSSCPGMDGTMFSIVNESAKMTSLPGFRAAPFKPGSSTRYIDSAKTYLLPGSRSTLPPLGTKTASGWG